MCCSGGTLKIISGYLTRCFTIVYMVFGICYAVQAQKKLIFENLNVENGLSKSSVVCISQDKSGIIWIGTTSGLNKYDGNYFSNFKNNPSDSASVSGSDISALLSDENDNLWVGTSNGLDLYLPAKEGFQHILRNKQITCLAQGSSGLVWVGSTDGLYTLEKQKMGKWLVKRQNILNRTNVAIWSIYHDSGNSLWLGTPEGLYNTVYQKGKTITKVYKNNSSDPNSISANDVTSIVNDKYGSLWIGTRKKGINLFDRKTQKFIRFVHSNNNANSLVNDNVRKIIADEDGNLWVGTQDGLSVLNVKSNRFTSYQHDASNVKSLSQNSIYELYRDFQGNVWIGTYFGGISKVDRYSTPFRIYQNDRFNRSLNSNVISAIVQDKHQNFWIGTEARGINFYDRKNNIYKEYKNITNQINSLSSNLVKSIIIDKNDILWIGMSRGGLDRFDPTQNVFTHFRSDPTKLFTLNSDIVERLFIDSKNRFWVGTDVGLNRFYPNSNRFEVLFNISGKYEKLNGFVTTIEEDRLHNLWVATSNGVYLLKDKSETFIPIVAKKFNKDLQYVNCIKEDISGRIWMGTDGSGLFSYDPFKGDINNYKIADGLPSERILSIEEDTDGNLWMGTDRGLSKFNANKTVFANYGLQDGLPGIEFNLGSSFKDNTGEIFFGGFKGIISFIPSEISKNPLAPKVVFTGLKLFNKEVVIGGKDNLLKESIAITKGLTFSHLQNVFAINFAALNYIKPLKNRYAYKLDGFEENWNYVDIPSAIYTNLSSGTYTLLVKASNNDGVWSTTPARMSITVLPPLWETWWAYIFYCIVIGLTIYKITLFVRAREKLKGELLFEQREVHRQQALHQMKINFFTKISHEIRTPLTLISGPIDNLIPLVKDDLKMKKPLQMIKSNSDRLIKLVSELLDFGMVELGKLKIKVFEQDIVLFLKEVVLSFEQIAEQRGINLTIQYSEDIIPVYFDREQMEKVFYNLLSNAFKFTPDGGEVAIEVSVEKEIVVVRVLDTGIGIPIESLDKIFLDFYQAHQEPERFSGSGLGLALSKGIVEMHKGEIFAENLSNDGQSKFQTCITVKFKDGESHFSFDDLKSSVVGKSDILFDVPAITDDVQQVQLQKEFQHASILIVEDNEDLRAFIGNSLKDMFSVNLAFNGLDGWQKALDLLPDLIISDVMMPEMNGINLCHKLKSDSRTSHIPVILLTALSGYGYHFQGLNVGADAYVTKPFDIKLLHLQINNLFMLRSAVQKKHMRNLMLDERDPNQDSQEDVFLEKLVKIIDANIDNEDLSLADLTSEMAMSKSVLYKKFNALTSLSLTDFIKIRRLKQAAVLLNRKDTSVGEVAIMVGFSDQKYFSKQFKKMYGITPSEFIRNTGNQIASAE